MENCVALVYQVAVRFVKLNAPRRLKRHTSYICQYPRLEIALSHFCGQSVCAYCIKLVQVLLVGLVSLTLFSYSYRISPRARLTYMSREELFIGSWEYEWLDKYCSSVGMIFRFIY